MLKNILELTGTLELKKEAQKTINGGASRECNKPPICPVGAVWDAYQCRCLTDC
ncbi:hypothetical protein [uncultured Dokdonia sp.]|uniref:hypothetical protein n=1 Tax=uncultured Dokdonia sp. TaxID=575653 RepID=UPI00261A158B|nr:hypothetical protein [uncultured Dokdonia sp.]